MHENYSSCCCSLLRSIFGRVFAGCVFLFLDFVRLIQSLRSPTSSLLTVIVRHSSFWRRTKLPCRIVWTSTARTRWRPSLIWTFLISPFLVTADFYAHAALLNFPNFFVLFNRDLHALTTFGLQQNSTFSTFTVEKRVFLSGHWISFSQL